MWRRTPALRAAGRGLRRRSRLAARSCPAAHSSFGFLASHTHNSSPPIPQTFPTMRSSKTTAAALTLLLLSLCCCCLIDAAAAAAKDERSGRVPQQGTRAKPNAGGPKSCFATVVREGLPAGRSERSLANNPPWLPKAIRARTPCCNALMLSWAASSPQPFRPLTRPHPCTHPMSQSQQHKTPPTLLKT